jgi:LmbE family N-acetylglucosaminyl deacetylase
MLNKLKKILIVCAHPDDEVIGCGGTISLLSKTAKIDLLVFTNGEGSRKFSSDEQYRKKTLQRKQMLQKSSKVLGIKNIHQLNFRDNQLDTYPLLEITKELEKYLKKYKPDTIFTHYKNDLNIDHRKVFEAVITATRPFKNKFIKNLLSFEITSSTELSYSKNQFNPNFFVDINDKIKLKKKSLNIYRNQFNKELGLLTIENIINLAKYRGSYIGSKYAEAFEIVRIII